MKAKQISIAEIVLTIIVVSYFVFLFGNVIF